MDLPNITSGMAILAEQINQISREVRASAITSFVGGNFNRSSCGTSLSIDQNTSSNTSTTPCPFRISDVSTPEVKKIRIASTTVNAPTGAVYPEGMSLDGHYEILITGTAYLYVKMVYKENDVVLIDGASAITIANETTLQTNTVNEEYVLIGVVTLTDNLLHITNICTSVTPNPCNLDWSTTPPPAPPPTDPPPTDPPPTDPPPTE